jgi:hypothetical protein
VPEAGHPRDVDRGLLLELNADRVRLWMFARAAAEPRDTWDADSLALARRLQ